MQVLSSGKVIGDFIYNDLIIEEDAKFEGRVSRKNSELKSRYNEIENRIGGFVSTKQEDNQYASQDTEKIK